MFQEERLLSILDYLEKNRKITIPEICELFDVSKDTARRDLIKLQERNAIIRTHGGALLPSRQYEVQGFHERESIESSIKEKIGKKATAFVNDHDHLLMDASTTVQNLAKFLTATNITVVTNSIDLASILLDNEETTVYLPGGKLHPKYRHLYGPSTIEKIKEYRANKVFMGVSGITSEGLFYKNEDDGATIREMIARSEQVIVLADHTKFGKQLFYRVCGLEKIDILITDKIPDENLAMKLSELKVQVVTVEEDR
ncbi:DeoR/GlpR family DNA-binding transcription regulator [Effusibacillus consociatus]|uniref:DeoR/GlpR family DNA-binding transcription regulator n=1 Tax=Effusibacillus consociatus TaxID=1117041 RepID=A0ABV9Q4I7_9BACL